MKTFVTTLFVMALLVIAAPASATTAIFVQEGFEVGEGFPAASQVDANANWTLGGDSVPGGSVGLGNINGNNVNSGVQSLEMVTTSGELLLRPHWVRDLSSTASVATPMTTATVSLSINYNYVPYNKHYPQDTWIYVTSHLGDGPTPTNRVAAIRLNSGVWDWKFGAAVYSSGASGQNVRNDLWHDLDMVFDFAADTVTYFHDGFQEFVDQLPIGTLVGTAGLGQLRIENGINDPSGVETNVTYVDDVFFSDEIPSFGIDGDINGDGQVDGLDLNLLGADWQSTSPVTPAADINGDGIVDGLDLNILGGNWQAGVPAPGAAIPEPASLALLGLGAIAMLRRRK